VLAEEALGPFFFLISSIFPCRYHFTDASYLLCSATDAMHSLQVTMLLSKTFLKKKVASSHEQLSLIQVLTGGATLELRLGHHYTD
jgi:hypothetical protein